jgi:rSAM/selenodomain-associated transferase 1
MLTSYVLTTAYNWRLLPLVIVFAKAPVPGRVKTRLGLEPQRAANLHSAFVRQTLRTLESCAGELEFELSTDEPTNAWADVCARRSMQVSGNLGERIYAALEGALLAGRPKAMVLGSDSPDLPAGHIRALLASRADVAIGPTEDGGFYAISCSRAHPAMFEGVHWSTGSALEDTLAASRRAGLTVEIGPAWFDIDRPDDLARLGL